jgi:LysM repeat protein
MTPPITSSSRIEQLRNQASYDIANTGWKYEKYDANTYQNVDQGQYSFNGFNTTGLFQQINRLTAEQKEALFDYLNWDENKSIAQNMSQMDTTDKTVEGTGLDGRTTLVETNYENRVTEEDYAAFDRMMAEYENQVIGEEAEIARQNDLAARRRQEAAQARMDATSKVVELNGEIADLNAEANALHRQVQEIDETYRDIIGAADADIEGIRANSNATTYAQAQADIEVREQQRDTEIEQLGTERQQVLERIAMIEAELESLKAERGDATMASLGIQTRQPTVATPATSPRTTASRSYTVKPGDTLGKVAKELGVSIADLTDQVPGGNINVIQVDQVYTA